MNYEDSSRRFLLIGSILLLLSILLLAKPVKGCCDPPPDLTMTERTIINISDCMNLSVHVEKASGNLSKGYSFKYCTQQANTKDYVCNCRDYAVNGTFSLNIISTSESTRMFYLTLNYSQYTLYGGDTRLLFYDNYETKKDEEPRTILNSNYYDYCPPIKYVNVTVTKEVPVYVNVTTEVKKEVPVNVYFENTTRIDELTNKQKSLRTSNIILILLLLSIVGWVIYEYAKSFYGD
jgi:hypothetical protein